MKHTRLCCVEMRRLLRKKSFWLIAALCCLTPLLGRMITTTTSGILSTKYIAYPVTAAGAAGGILWALLSITEASRMHRTGTDVLTDAVSSPTALPAARMTAQIILSVGVAFICMLIWLPYTAYKMDYLFSLPFYMLNYAILLVPSWWISILFAESLYHLTRRAEAAVLIYALAAGCCLLPGVWLSLSLRWIAPAVLTYSDAFPTYWPLRIALYSRVIWLALFLALYLLSLASVRKYQRGFLFSFLRGCKRAVLPVGAALLTASAVFLGTMQPFVDHGPRVWQDREIPEFTEPAFVAVKCRYSITPEMLTGTVTGSAEYELMQNGNRRIDDYSFSFTLNCGYTVDSVILNDTVLPHETRHDDNHGYRSTVFTLPEDFEGNLQIHFHGIPTQTNANMPMLVMDTVDPEFIALFNTSIMPWLNSRTMMSPYGSEYTITLPEGVTPFLDFAQFDRQEPAGDGRVTWYTKVDKEGAPFSFVAGRYLTEQVFAGGVNIAFTYGEIFRDTVRENDIIGALKTVIDYCTAHYGPLGYTADETFSMMQTSALIMGGWANPGWSTWMESELTPEALTDESKGASAKEVFIHELVHQWWGAFGIDFAEEDIWSCEGMTVYSTYRIAKELYGEEYAKKYYVDHWREDVQQQDRDFYNRHPEYLDMLPEFMRDSLKLRNQNINWYSRLPLMLLKAEQLLGGEEEMDALLSRIYKREIEYKLSNGETAYSFADFLEDSGLKEEDLHVDENTAL